MLNNLSGLVTHTLVDSVSLKSADRRTSLQFCSSAVSYTGGTDDLFLYCSAPSSSLDNEPVPSTLKVSSFLLGWHVRLVCIWTKCPQTPNTYPVWHIYRTCLTVKHLLISNCIRKYFLRFTYKQQSHFFCMWLPVMKSQCHSLSQDKEKYSSIPRDITPLLSPAAKLRGFQRNSMCESFKQTFSWNQKISMST